MLTCRQEFEGFTALKDHRAKQHPSNKICNKIPNCTGVVNGKKCWYVHPSLNATDNNPTIYLPSQQSTHIECRECKNIFENKNKFMEHYTKNHTSHNKCRDWIKK